NWVDLKWRSINAHSHDLCQERGEFCGNGELHLLLNRYVGHRARGTFFPPYLLLFENRVKGEWKKGRRSSYSRALVYFIQVNMYKKVVVIFVLRSVVDPIYVSTMAQEHVYSSAVGRLLNCEVPLRAQYIRMLFREITRISNHSLASTTHAMDVGASTLFLWASQEWEKLLEFHERIQGARMHASFIRPGGVAQDLTLGSCRDIDSFAQQFASRINESEEMLTGNHIWKQRLVDIGTVTTHQGKDWGFSSVMLRGSGECWDSRRATPYDVHDQSDPDVPVEIRQSFWFIVQCPNQMPSGMIKADDRNLFLYKRFFGTSSSYTAVEAPKGEFGIIMVSNGSNRPYRCKIRAPGSSHSQGLDSMSKHHMPADVVTIIGTQDIVSEEVDR
ncbi:hypothetical protein MKX01_013716, partial [Papaver californicum]